MIKLIKISFNVFESWHVKKHAEVVLGFLLSPCGIFMLDYVCFMAMVSLVIHYIY